MKSDLGNEGFKCMPNEILCLRGKGLRKMWYVFQLLENLWCGRSEFLQCKEQNKGKWTDNTRGGNYNEHFLKPISFDSFGGGGGDSAGDYWGQHPVYRKSPNMNRETQLLLFCPTHGTQYQWCSCPSHPLPSKGRWRVVQKRGWQPDGLNPGMLGRRLAFGDKEKGKQKKTSPFTFYSYFICDVFHLHSLFMSQVSTSFS